MSSDLISREYLLSKVKGKCDDVETQGYVDLEDIEDAPPTDIIECARAIQEYCITKPCYKCRFYTEDYIQSFCLFRNGNPVEWDLPKSEE